MLLFAAMMACGLLLIVPTIYFKVLRPVARLRRQADVLASGELETAFVWRGDDELSRLGRLLERMRQRLRDSFARIQELAVTDELTGLPNRRAFFHDARLALDLSDRYQRPLAMVLIDLDHFKQVNDGQGHAIGDQVLREFAVVVKGMIRRTDICARLGGEEFAVCMPETALSEALVASEKIRRRLESHAFARELTVTASFGLVAHTPGQPLDALLQAADAAMYQAKALGRNRVVAL